MGTQGQGICRRLVGTEESAEGSCCRDHARSDVLGLPDASIGYVGSGYSQFILWKVAA